MITIHKDSHLDHAIPQVVRDWVIDHFIDHFKQKELPSFLLLTVTYPGGPIIPCGLHGPIMGDEPVGDDECFLAPRGNREHLSRLCHRAPRMQSAVTIIVGEHDGLPHVLYTMFGGPIAMKEPRDPNLKDSERAEAERFWSEHALSKEGV